MREFVSHFDLPDAAVILFRRLLSRRRSCPQPWVWERLATSEEIEMLRRTDLGRAA